MSFVSPSVSHPQCVKMVNGLKVEDRLNGSSNFASWKPRVLIALEEDDLLEIPMLLSHLMKLTEPSGRRTKDYG